MTVNDVRGFCKWSAFMHSIANIYLHDYVHAWWCVYTCVCHSKSVLPISFRRCLDILSGLSTFDQTLIYFDSERKQLCLEVCRN